jgi:hypothetical protein
MFLIAIVAAVIGLSSGSNIPGVISLVIGLLALALI